MIFLPDTNTCITLLRRRDDRLIARWKSVNITDIVLCSIVVYELRYGAQPSSDPSREHSKLDLFLSPFASLPFDDQCARRCAEVRAELERAGRVIGPHDCKSLPLPSNVNLRNRWLKLFAIHNADDLKIV